MKLTKTGRDYQLAVLLAVGAGLLTGEVLFAALGLALAFASAISLALLRGMLPKSVEISAEEGRVRLFKGEEGAITLRTPGLRNEWARVEVESVKFDGPVTTSVAVRGPDKVRVTFTPETSCRYTGAVAEVEVRDALGLFAVSLSVQLGDVVVDSLPVSLIARQTPVYVPPLVVGDSPAGAPGKGQEFYGIEEYTEHSESRDILWKRAARAPDRPLLARVREANSPEWVRLELTTGEMAAKDRPALVDLECEALGELGRSLLFAGVGVKVVGPGGTVRTAEDDDTLADAIMEASAARRASDEDRAPRFGPLISVVVGAVEPQVLEGLPRGPAVYIGGKARHVQDPFAVDFTGAEPLTGVVARVLGS